MVSVTVLIPAVEYTTPDGFSTISVAGEAPLPKVQPQLTFALLPVLVKLTGKPVHCGAVEVKLATGVSLIVIDCVEVWVQFWSLIVKVTVLLPPEVYNTPVGFCAVEVAGDEPGPKFHA